ncbi:MAG TPA: DNA methyltransferase, partial [Salinarimonas sp.]|nr:DNA methyltransferase [Salinarimonas sp.]
MKSTPLPTHRRNDLVPALDLVQRAPSSLASPARNVRQLRQEHVHRVAASIGSLGFCAPILIDETGTVLDGAVRLEAARVLGLEAVPCIVAGHLTAAEKRALRLALNRLGERGAWDLGSLRVELQELLIEDLDLEITGFDGAEIDSILLEDEPPSHEPGPLTPDLAAQPRARPGDVYRLGAHRLICGDARDPAVWARLMGEERARLVLTDEPYNVPIRGHVTGGAHREFAMASSEMSEAEFEAFNEAWMRAALEHLVEGGVLGTFIDWRGLPVVQEASRRLGLVPLNLVVWSKTNAGMGSLYRSQHELLPLYKKGEEAHVNNVELGRKGRWRSNVWSYAGASSLGSDARAGLKEHPTVKPVAMLEDALADLTHRGDVVADPFLGS